MAIEYKDDWLAGFRDSINSLTNLKMTQKQIANDERKEAFNQQTTLAKMKQDETNQIVNANVGLSNALLGIGKARSEYNTTLDDLSSKKSTIMKEYGLDPLNPTHVKLFEINPKYSLGLKRVKTLEGKVKDSKDYLDKSNEITAYLKSLLNTAYPTSNIQSTQSDIEPTFTYRR